MIKSIFKNFLIKISRIIYYLIPEEFSPENKNKLYKIYEKKKIYECAEQFEKYLEKSALFTKRKGIQKYAITESLINDENQIKFYLEFGVYKGETANFFSNYVKKLYAFDSFEGLKENWAGFADQKKGTFNLDKKIPKLKSNIEPICGWVQDTLEIFLKKNNPTINFVHFDVDTYESTKFILQKIKPFLNKNAILLFDQLYNYVGWKEGEYKALQEVFKEDEYTYVAFNLKGSQAVIKLN